VKKIAIYGASGHGKVVADIATSCGYEVVFFVDDDEGKNEFGGLKVRRLDDVSGAAGVCFALGLGSNKIRESKYDALKALGFELPLLVHPSAVVSPSARLAQGCVVMPNVVVNADAKIGIGVILNSSCVIEHDCIIGDFAHISPLVGLAGGVNIGERCHIGIGAKVIQGLKIGANSIVGAGGVVIGDIEENVLAVGVPAKTIKSI